MKQWQCRRLSIQETVQQQQQKHRVRLGAKIQPSLWLVVEASVLSSPLPAAFTSATSWRLDTCCNAARSEAPQHSQCFYFYFAHYCCACFHSFSHLLPYSSALGAHCGLWLPLSLFPFQILCRPSLIGCRPAANECLRLLQMSQRGVQIGWRPPPYSVDR